MTFYTTFCRPTNGQINNSVVGHELMISHKRNSSINTLKIRNDEARPSSYFYGILTMNVHLTTLMFLSVWEVKATHHVDNVGEEFIYPTLISISASKV